MAKDIPTDVQNAVEKGLGTYNIDITGELEAAQISDTRYEVHVPFSGELKFDNVFSNQGRLLYNKEAEIVWEGVEDGMLVLSVDAEN